MNRNNPWTIRLEILLLVFVLISLALPGQQMPQSGPAASGPTWLIPQSTSSSSLSIENLANLTLTDVALPMGFQDRLSHGRALVAADWNGDGLIDFFVGNPGISTVLDDESYILWNNGPDGNGNYTFTKGQVLMSGQLAFTATVFDFDNDGDPDLFIGIGGLEGIGLDYLFRNDNGVFTDVSQQAGIQGPRDGSGKLVPHGTASGTVFDYDKDGCLDLFVAARKNKFSLILPGNLGWRDSLFHNNCDGTFTDVTVAAGLDDTTSSQTTAVGDFDNDGWPDLLVPYFDDTGGLGMQFYKNNHDGTFTRVAVDVGSLGTAAGWAAGVADFDNDGWLDAMVWAQGTPGNPDSHALLMNHGNWTFTNEASNAGIVPPGVPVPVVMGCQIGDLNNDGYPDLIMANGDPVTGMKDNLWISTYPVTGLHFEDDSSLFDYAAAPDPNCQGNLCNPPYPYRGHAVVLYDFDGDGDLDMFMLKGGPAALANTVEPNRAFRNDGGNTGNWLFVDLHGTVSNPEGIGSRVKVTASQSGANSRSIFMEAMAGANFSAGGPHEIHFGLGSDDTIDQVKVSWPSGIQTVLNGVAINRRLSIDETTIQASTFNDGLTDGWISRSGTWSVQNRAYSQQATTGKAISVKGGVSVSDYTVVGKLTYNSGSQQVALLGRTSSNAKNTYGVLLRRSTAQLFKTISGVMTLLGSPISISTMTTGRSYIVSLTMRGSVLQMTVDGVTSSTVVDSSITKGSIGLLTNNTTASFDNIAVY